MGKKKFYSTILFFIISIIVLFIIYLGAEFYCINQSNNLHILDPVDEEISISVTVSKQWDDSENKQVKPIGAQYDGVITNKSNQTFREWVVILEFSEDLVIDSSWNGIFQSSGNHVTFIAEGIPACVVTNSTATFGAVMYSENLMTLENYIIEGYKEVLIKDLPLFWILATLAIIWIIALIIYIVFHYKTIVYNRRLELDSKIILQSISTLTNFIDAKDAYTRNHSTRVAIYSFEIGRRLKMNKNDLDNLYYIALMHDCGKIGIPDELLNKLGKLSNEEYKKIQSHTEIGQKMLGDFNAIPGIRDGAYYHHERFDGTGHPMGLKGFDIPLCARIICVADSYDAMSSDRCYRIALSKEKVLTEIITNSGKQFDPEICNIMISLIESDFVEKIKVEYPLN